MRRHRRLVPFDIQIQSSLASDIIRQINGESVCVIKLKDHITRDGLVSNLLQCLLKNRHAIIERPGKLLFLALQGCRDRRLLGGELWISLSHLPDQIGHQLSKKGLLGAQLISVSNGTTNNAPQYVAPPLVTRCDTICNQKRSRTKMIRDHSQ